MSHHLHQDHYEKPAEHRTKGNPDDKRQYAHQKIFIKQHAADLLFTHPEQGIQSDFFLAFSRKKKNWNTR